MATAVICLTQQCSWCRFDQPLARALLPNLNPNPLQQRPLQEITQNSTQFKLPFKFWAEGLGHF